MKTATKKKPAAPAPAKKQYVLFAAWSDTPPEFIGLFEGTDVEVKAWCAGYTAASRGSSLGGDAVTLEEIVGDPEGHGLTAAETGPLLLMRGKECG